VQFPPDIARLLQACKFEHIIDAWELVLGQFGNSDEAKAALGRVDRFYLLTTLLHRPDAFHPWLYARCREVEASPDGYLDLWAREHYKSTIITFAGIIQEIVNDPEITIGIFSHTKPVARKFMNQLKTELETNIDLKRIYSDVFYDDPKNQSPRWSEEKGIVVKRKSNPKEATIEGHGLVDGQPTGAHFALRVYDDVVTRESVGTPEQVQKTTDAWALSDNLGARMHDGRLRAWHIGTRYSFADTYQEILNRKALIPRIFAATEDGTPNGKPVFLTQSAWEDKKQKQGPSIIACQQLQNPAAGNEAMFNKDWLRFADVRPATLNVYIMCDPASSRKKGTDKTSIKVVGVDAALNKYLLDGYHHKMGLAERWVALRDLRKRWMNAPGVQFVKVGYERYGMTSDLEYFEERMMMERDSWLIHELAWPREGPGSKYDRIQRLTPDFANGRFWLPAVAQGETKNQMRMREEGRPFRILAPIRRMDHEGNIYSVQKRLIEEFLTYPFSPHDDAIDCLSRIYDMDIAAPIIIDESELEPETFIDGL
jgi:hypothetical protein